MFSISAISSSDCSLPGATSRTTTGTRSRPATLRGAPAAFAGDDLKAIADLADDDRLDDAVGADRLRQLLQPRIVDMVARLEVVRLEAIDVGFDRRGARGSGASGMSALRPLPSAGRFSISVRSA